MELPKFNDKRGSMLEKAVDMIRIAQENKQMVFLLTSKNGNKYRDLRVVHEKNIYELIDELERDYNRDLILISDPDVVITNIYFGEETFLKDMMEGKDVSKY